MFQRPPPLTAAAPRAHRFGFRSGWLAGFLALSVTAPAIAQAPQAQPPEPQETTTQSSELAEREALLLRSAAQALSVSTNKTIELLVRGKTIALMDELTHASDAKSTIGEEIARRVDQRLAATTRGARNNRKP
ncbi:MAG: hypothetical protein GY733_13300 [bacterium]|nr:hypothetical protein [bacterium]